MPTMTTVTPLREDQPPDAPGLPFNCWTYCLALAQSGLAKPLGGAFATLNALAWHANKAGHAWPSIPTLAAEVGCSERQVLRDIAVLVASNAIHVGKRPGLSVAEGTEANLYTVLPLEGVRSLHIYKRKERPARKANSPMIVGRAGGMTHVSSGALSDVSSGSEEGEGDDMFGGRGMTCLAEGDDMFVSPIKEERTNKNVPNKNVPDCGADKPRPARRSRATAIDLQSTEHDQDSTTGRKLGLKMARDVLGFKTVSVKALGRYETFCDGLLDRGWEEDDLRAWMDWLDSGSQYWRGKGYLFQEERMLAELCAWDGQDRPEVKAEPAGRSQAGRRLDPAEQASRQAQAGYEARYGN